ncbi:hypothetical protein BT63DRAFT_415553 [Microthyrium microscopicum]|uniref:Uncharacterized protein n=1 Tax=Microthyrium microscopicum TaxID=703497 RepID=A0A6A6U8X3_9PEZI|nr:hypothetical protein BT63DRAFT_415553 [Microthyrium microscopicum]
MLGATTEGSQQKQRDLVQVGLLEDERLLEDWRVRCSRGIRTGAPLSQVSGLKELKPEAEWQNRGGSDGGSRGQRLDPGPDETRLDAGKHPVSRQAVKGRLVEGGLRTERIGRRILSRVMRKGNSNEESNQKGIMICRSKTDQTRQAWNQRAARAGEQANKLQVRTSSSDIQEAQMQQCKDADLFLEASLASQVATKGSCSMSVLSFGNNDTGYGELCNSAAATAGRGKKGNTIERLLTRE